MVGKENSGKKGSLCPQCGKHIAGSDRAGSLTSYLFQPFNCNCARSSGHPAIRPDQSASGDTFCPDCGLQSVTAGPAGSITGFLFQSTRCKCIPKMQPADGEMARRFWKLKEAGAGSTFGLGSVSGASTIGPGKHIKAPIFIDLLPGSVIGGVYRIGRLIGAGGMGEVYLAEHLAIGKTCAIKLIPPDQVTDSAWQRFQMEAKSIAGLEHINLVKVTDLGIHEGCLPYYAMEYIEGETLADKLAAHGPMPLPAVLDVFMQICDGVDYAHRKGLVHRDIKPANIMLIKSKSGNFTVKIFDFGLVKLTKRDRAQQSLTSVGDVFGSPFYMSPEQCTGEKIDNRSDIYSVGCTLFECLTGRPPFIRGTAMDVMGAHQNAGPPSLDSVVGTKVFPESMELVLAKLLRKNPVERYQTLLELRDDLKKVAQGEEVQPFYVSRSQKPNTAEGAYPRTAERVSGSKPMIDAGGAEINWRASAIAIFVFVVVGALVARGFLNAKHAPAKVANKQIEDLALQNLPLTELDAVGTATIEPASAKEARPFSTIVEENGKKWRIFDFPEDVALGSIRVMHESSKSAKGERKYLADDILVFKPGVMALKYPQYFKRFRSGDIFQLEMPPTYALNGTASDAYIDELSLAPGVKWFDFANYDGLTNNSAKSLENLHSATGLDFGQSEMTPASIAKLSILKQIDWLSLSCNEDISPIAISLGKSSKVTDFNFSKSSASMDGIAAMAQWPQLEKLRFGELVPPTPASTTKALHLLRQAPKLRSLTMETEHPSLDDLAVVATYKNLEELHLFRFAPDNSETSIKALEILSRMPRLHCLGISVLPDSPRTIAVLKSFKSLNAVDFFYGDNLAASPIFRRLRAAGFRVNHPEGVNMWHQIEIRSEGDH